MRIAALPPEAAAIGLDPPHPEGAAIPDLSPSQLFADRLPNDPLDGLGLDGLLQRFIDQRLVAAVACFRFEVRDYRAIEKDIHALFVRQHGARCAALAQYQLARGDVSTAQGFVLVRVS